MIDYEDLILARQEAIEIWEDDPDDPYLQDPEVRQYLEDKCKLSSLYGTVMSESEDENDGRK